MLYLRGKAPKAISLSLAIFITRKNLVHISKYFNTKVCTRRRQWQPTPVVLPGKSHGRRGLIGCSQWGREESDTTEGLRFDFSFSCIGGGNGNPLHCSCLENPMDRGAWWAAVHGVAKSRIWLSVFTFTFHFHALKKEMATHSSVLA